MIPLESFEAKKVKEILGADVCFKIGGGAYCEINPPRNNGGVYLDYYLQSFSTLEGSGYRGTQCDTHTVLSEPSGDERQQGRVLSLSHLDGVNGFILVAVTSIKPSLVYVPPRHGLN